MTYMVADMASRPAQDPERVQALFGRIARHYDLANTVISFGRDAAWRRKAARATGLQPGQAALDVACGTGRLAVELARLVGPAGRVVGADFSPEMLAVAAHLAPGIDWQTADALALPFADGAFDAATIAFGLRNLPDFLAGFREMRRVVRPGGRVVCLELSLPRSRAWARLFHATFRRAAPMAASIAGGRRAAYRYLPDSLDGFPTPERLAMMMRSAGLADVRFWRLSTGVVALHRGTVPD